MGGEAQAQEAIPGSALARSRNGDCSRPSQRSTVSGVEGEFQGWPRPRATRPQFARSLSRLGLVYERMEAAACGALEPSLEPLVPHFPAAASLPPTRAATPASSVSEPKSVE